MSKNLNTIGLTLLALVVSFTANNASASQNDPSHFSGQVYTATCRFEHPLDTYDACAAWSYAGQSAAACAAAQAKLACENDYNADCVSEGAIYNTIISEDFVGYKACEATVTIHGYKQQ